jgi:predicted dehydrogenase/threonine dehydrogenase-like Zn-dependent dehydrogenase
VLSSGMVLVRAHYSLISAGTESGTVTTARMSYIAKARSRPKDVKQVVDTLKQKGPVQTYRDVMKKLDAHSALGYSVAGEIVDVAPDVRGFRPGDLVACGGAGYASHAEYVAVPTNLCVRLHPGANLRDAAYNTVGAIALQGIRQADLRLGETCAVIGLGLIGHLTSLMLRASGVRVVGIDVAPSAVELAKEHCVDAGFATDEPGLEGKIEEFTGGIGADAVIIAAGTSSEGPINLAGRIARPKGKVVIVGWVGTAFDQDTYYKKELDLRLSCSYGPGRYDPAYEERGIDYPVAHVRWTENRNMQAFQELLRTGSIDVGYASTHTFKLEDAPAAYDMILGKGEPFIGILIEYDVEAQAPRANVEFAKARRSGRPTIAFIGAGSYAQGNLLPNIKGSDVVLRTVMTATGTSARSVADRYGFEKATSDANEIWRDEAIDTVFVTTRHDSHAQYVLEALRSGRNVFVEKPLCISEEELLEITGAYEKLVEARKSAVIMVGYNRRFSPLTTRLKKIVGEGPMSMVYRVNAGAMPSSHWMQSPDVGGGRIVGEACHFVDYLIYMNGSLPVEVHAAAMDEPAHLEDTVTISVRFENGSIGAVHYYANGSKALPKEYIEVYRAGVTGVLSDFRELRVYDSGRPSRTKLPGQNKGQPEMMTEFLAAVREGKPSPIPFDEIRAGMLATLRAVESVRTRKILAL